MLKLENDESEKKAVNNEGGPHLGRSSKKDTSIRWTKLSHESYPDIRYYLDWMQHCLARVLTPFIGLCRITVLPSDHCDGGCAVMRMYRSPALVSWRAEDWCYITQSLLLITFADRLQGLIQGWEGQHQTREREGGMQGNGVSWSTVRSVQPAIVLHKKICTEHVCLVC